MRDLTLLGIPWTVKSNETVLLVVSFFCSSVHDITGRESTPGDPRECDPDHGHATRSTNGRLRTKSRVGRCTRRYDVPDLQMFEVKDLMVRKKRGLPSIFVV